MALTHHSFLLRSTLTIILISLIATSLLGCSHRNQPILIDGLSYPRGLAISETGTLLIAEAGGGRILEMANDGILQEVITGLPHTHDSGPGGAYPAGPSSVVAANGVLYIVVGEFKGDRFGRLYRVTLDGSYEAITAPTGIDLPAQNRFANPYDLISAPEIDGWIVADPGRNALIGVASDGITRDYALFDPFSVPGRAAKVEVVPTGIARGPDGDIYVGSLTGFPYPPRTAIVWHVKDINNDGDALDPGEVRPYLEGFTAITDIIFDSMGRLYVAEFTSDMLKASEGGNLRENTPKFPGTVMRYDGETTEILVENTISPTSLIVLRDNLYISEEFAGRIRRVSLEER